MTMSPWHKVSRILVVCVLVFTVFKTIEWWQSPLRELPDGVTQVQSDYESTGIAGDGVWWIKARCSPSQASEYVNKIKARGRVGSGAGWRRNTANWWDPPASPTKNESIQIIDERDFYTILYVNSVLYIQIASH